MTNTQYIFVDKQGPIEIQMFLVFKKYKYKYEYILANKNGKIQIRLHIFELVFPNTNRSINNC